MQIQSISHKGLQRFIYDDDTRGINGNLINRTRNIIAVLVLAPDVENIIGPPGWRIHQLIGDREGVWSISVSGNWRITFEIEDNEIINLDLEDYH